MKDRQIKEITAPPGSRFPSERASLDGPSCYSRISALSSHRRRLLRGLALALFLCSAVFCFQGSKLLASSAEKALNPLDEFFVVGSQRWGIFFNNPQPRCIGTLQSSLGLKPNALFSLRGEMIVPYNSKPLPLNLNLAAEFGPLNMLEKIKLLANAEGYRAELVTLQETDSPLQGHFLTPFGEFNSKLKMPTPIYLVKRAANRYRLRLPQGVELKLPAQAPAASFAAGLSRQVELRKITAKEDAACKISLAELASSEHFQAPQADLAVLSNLFIISQKLKQGLQQ